MIYIKNKEEEKIKKKEKKKEIEVRGKVSRGKKTSEPQPHCQAHNMTKRYLHTFSIFLITERERG